MKQSNDSASGRRAWAARAMERLQRRFAAARPGSVLIMVVALLVMLAIIGTAAMSTARVDRVSSGYNIASTQIDLLLDSVKQVVVSRLTDDLFGPGGPNLIDSPATDPDPSVAKNDTRDAMIGSRHPERYQGPGGNGSVAATGVPVWRNISYPAMRNGGLTSGLPYRYEIPNEVTDPDVSKNALPMPKVAFQPTYMMYNGEAVPALKRMDTSKTFLAADADGDGIADSVYYKLPMSPLNGITYYAAVRVIDHNSAINLNTAWDPSYETGEVKADAAVTLSFAGVFPGSIALTGDGGDETTFGKYHLLSLSPNDAQGLDIRRFKDNVNPAYFQTSTQKLIRVAGAPPQTEDAAGVTPSDRSDIDWLTPGDCLHHELGRRVSNPWWWKNNGGTLKWFGGGVRPYGIDASVTMSFQFCLANGSYTNSTVETDLAGALVQNNGVVARGHWQPYTPDQADGWYQQNFEVAANKKIAARSFLTAYNPVRNDVVRRSYLYGGSDANPYAVGSYPTKTNPNTAPFEELHQSFYDVMSGATSAAQPERTPFDDAAGYTKSAGDNYFGMKFNATTFASDTTEIHPSRMFRSPVRGLNGASLKTLHPVQVMRLRSAIAAMNTISMREPDADATGVAVKVPHRLVNLPIPAGAGNGAAEVIADVFGVKRQPFITEVYLNNYPGPKGGTNTPTGPDGKPRLNPRGFAAIELYNPYDVPLNLNGYKLKIIDRKTDLPANTPLKMYTLPDNSFGTGAFGTNPLPPSIDPMPTDPNAPAKPYVFNNVTIQPGQYLVIWNYKDGVVADPPDPDDAEYLPSSIAPVAGAIYLKTLHMMIGNELVLTRPSTDDGIDAPVDSFDATGLNHNVAPPDQAPVTDPCYAWHYVRGNATAAANNRAWHFVYPGRYDATGAPTQEAGHQQGTEFAKVDLMTGDDTLAIKTWAKTPIQLGLADQLNSREKGGDPGSTSTFAIQIANTGTTPLFKTSGGKPMFPFNGFARTGDLLHVTFIGSYTIKPTTPPGANERVAYLEVNALPIDAAFAEDTVADDDVDSTSIAGVTTQGEEIGRFAPILKDMKLADGTVRSYDFAKRFFDYFSAINSPAQDFMPNASTIANPVPIRNASASAKPNRDGAGDKQTEDTVGSEGLININTANWKVMSALPLIPMSTTGPFSPGTVCRVDLTKNEALARRICYFRDVDDGSGKPHGPFRSIYELALIPEFRTAEGTFSASMDPAADPSTAPLTMGGDWSILKGASTNTAKDNVRWDFEEKYLNLTRISNLITLRSDVYTAYIMVQGWRDAGSTSAKLIAQRRMAFIVDRSQLSKDKPQASPPTYPIPTVQ